jgi:hypothetical protein
MKRFKVLEDIKILDNVLIHKNETIILNDDKYEIKADGVAITLSLEQLKNDKRFLEIDELRMNFEEVDLDWDEVKTWRLQLDIKTSKSKLPMIQSLIEETISKYL